MELGELRSLAHGVPSPARFEAICTQLDGLPGARRGEAIDYLEGALRGWPDEARMAPGAWVRALGRGEQIEGVRLTRGAGLHNLSVAQARRIAAQPMIRLWTRLAIVDPAEGGVVEALARAEALGQVRHLLCLNVRQGISLARTMRAARWRLDALVLWRVSVRGGDLGRALRTPALASLRALHLQHGPWARGVADAIVAHAPSSLRALDLSGATLSGGELERLGDAAIAAQLTELGCGRLAGVQPEAVWTALLSGRWSALERLRADFLPCDQRGVRAMRGAPWHRTLHTLDLSASARGAMLQPVLHALREHGALRHLKLRHANAQPHHLSAEAQPVLERLDALALGEVGLTDETLRMLSRHLHVRCRELRLQQCQLDDAQLRTLLHAAPSWPALEVLELDHNRLTDASADALTDTARLPALHHTMLDGNPVTPSTKDQIARDLAQRPPLPVETDDAR